MPRRNPLQVTCPAKSYIKSTVMSLEAGITEISVFKELGDAKIAIPTTSLLLARLHNSRVPFL
jgi:hypothetical protein